MSDIIHNLRVTNERYTSLCKPEEGETVIWIDRRNPLLGNPFHMKEHSIRERMIRIEQHRRLVHADFAKQGPIYQCMKDIATRISDGERICLHCQCSPLPCHGDNYVEIVRKILSDTLAEEKCAEFMLSVDAPARFAHMKRLLSSKHPQDCGR